eukprot:359064-Chlamydomonas_euryale.AAC.1
MPNTRLAAALVPTNSSTTTKTEGPALPPTKRSSRPPLQPSHNLLHPRPSPASSTRTESLHPAAPHLVVASATAVEVLVDGVELKGVGRPVGLVGGLHVVVAVECDGRLVAAGAQAP